MSIETFATTPAPFEGRDNQWLEVSTLTRIQVEDILSICYDL
jgi:hypothetical protein